MRSSHVLPFLLGVSLTVSLGLFAPFTVSAQPGASLLPPSNDHCEDTDTDGLFDYLVIELTVEVYEAAEYTVQIRLNDTEGSFAFPDPVGGYLNVGIHVIAVPIEGIHISDNGADGPFEVWAQLIAIPSLLIDQFVDMTDPYLCAQFEPMPAEFVDVGSPWGIDIDGNERFEFLSMNYTLEVGQANDYRITCDVSQDSGSGWYFVGYAQDNVYLPAGTHLLAINIRGSGINAAGISGPFYATLRLEDMPGGIPRYLDAILRSTAPYDYQEFEAGSITTHISSSSAVIDGVYTTGEWDDAVSVDLSRPDMENPFGAIMLAKNTMTHLYLCMDVIGDLTEDLADHASIAFDTENDNDLTDAREDQFVVGAMAGSLTHGVYSEAVGVWVVHDCDPPGDPLADHIGLSASSGFGTSAALGANHRIYEFSIPLSLLDIVPGSTLGFATNGNSSYGVYDSSTDSNIAWPYHLQLNNSLVDYGDLTIGWYPITTTPTLAGTLGDNGWYVSAVNLTLVATGGQLGPDVTWCSLNGLYWEYYSTPVQISAEGVNTIGYYSRDLAGNGEVSKYIEVKLDSTAPTTTASVSERNLTLAATDGTSGVSEIWYSVDGGSWLNYTEPVELSGETNHTVQYYSVDSAGNTEQTKTLEVDKEKTEGGGFFGLNFWMVLLTIGLIAGASIAAIYGMRRKAKESDAKSAIKDIGTSMAQLMDDTGSSKEPPPQKTESPPEKPGG